MARTYINRFGRFSSPDPLAGDLGNPQSLNRYAYAANDPINLNDPSGAMCSLDEIGDASLSYNDCFGGGGGGYGGGGGGAPYWAPGDPLYGGDPMDPDYARYVVWVNSQFSTHYFVAFNYVPYREDGEHYLFLPLMMGMATNPRDWGSFTDSVGGPVLKVLKGKNECSRYFNSSVLVGLNQASLGTPLALVVPTTAADFFKSDYLEPGDSLKPNVGAATTEGAGVNAVIAVNSNANGAFISAFQGVVGPFRTGSVGAQTIMLLHELAHTLLLIPPDSDADVKEGFPQSIDNTKTILDHCLEAVNSVL